MIGKKFGVVFLCCAILVGCNKSSYDQVSRFHDDGRARPVVALIPVFDRSDAKMAWSLSEEFTDHLKQCLLKKNHFYLSTPDIVNAAIEKIDKDQNPFVNDLSWVKDVFKSQEFVIFTELIEHDIHAKEMKNTFMERLTPSHELSMTIRIRVVDLRSEEPQIILQEMVHQNHLVTKPSDEREYTPDKWKKFTYALTPIGFAHSQLTKEVAKRIEEYIILSKSN